MEVTAFAAAHLGGVLRLCEHEGWDTLCADPDRTLQAFSAAGAVSLVALRAGEVVGFAQALSDGAIQAYLARLLVAESHRRQGVAQRLVREIFVRSGAQRVDLLAQQGSDAFYRSFPHRGPWRGYRIDGLDRAEAQRRERG
jgi:ribosomal protein S18 acetylase RimI-like enzyme